MTGSIIAGTAVDAPIQQPYVGPRAFETDESSFFFGRDEETEILTSLVMTSRCALFYAQSGAGKSSLLRAGVIPDLTRIRTPAHGSRRARQKMQVLPIATVGGAVPDRLTAAVANVFVFNALFSMQPDGDPAALAGLTLSEGLAAQVPAHESADAPVAATHVLLIFDQFEEIFTTNESRWQDRRGFFEQVHDVLEMNPDLHVLFTMREDYIAQLRPYLNHLENQLRDRYRLERLKRGAALQAVTLPAERAGRRFADGVAGALVDNLRRVQRQSRHPEPLPDGAEQNLGEYVEPVHLQIVCRQLWLNLPADRATILFSDLQQHGDVDEALTAFYEEALAAALSHPGLNERRLRTWFGEKLITPARTRGLVYRDEERGETAGLPNVVVDLLRDTWLIRGDMRGGDTWYELTHDRLIEPILAANQAWHDRYYNPLSMTAEAWIQSGRDPAKLLRGVPLGEAEAFAADRPGDLTEDEQDYLDSSIRQAQLEAELARQAALRRRWLAGTAIVIILILASLTGYALYQRNLAEEERRLAEEQRDLAETQRRIAVARELATESVIALGTDPELSIMLALESLSLHNTPMAQEALHNALAAARIEHTLQGHTASVTDVAYAPDGSALVSAGYDGRISQWDPSSGDLLAEFAAHDDRIYDIDLSADGARLATASRDGTARIWDLPSGELLLTLGGHTNRVLSVAFSPDGTQLATAGGDRQILLWNSESGTLLHTLVGHSDDVWVVAFDPTGTQLVSGSRDRRAIVWDVASGRELWTIAHHADTVMDVAFSPDGTRLATASWDRTVQLIDTASGQILNRLTGHRYWVRAVTFSNDGRRLATSSWDNTVRLWDVETGRELYTLAGHSRWVDGIDFSPDGRHLASASADGTVKVWNAAETREVHTLTGHAAAVKALALTPDGHYLASGDADGVLTRWDTGSGRPQWTSVAHTLEITSVAYSPDARHIATASADRAVKIWDSETGQQIRTLSGHPVPVLSVAYHPTANLIASAGTDGTIILWDAQSGAQLETLAAHGDRVNQIVFSRDGHLLASAGGDRTVKIWDAQTRPPVLLQTLRPSQADDGRAFALDFSPDGALLAAAGADELVYIWETATGAPVASLGGHADRILSVAFSPDGDRLATCGWDGTVRLWSPANEHDVITFTGHDDRVFDVLFSPDGRELYSAGQDRNIRAVMLDVDALVELAESRLTRQMTADECRRYLTSDLCAARFVAPPTTVTHQ